MARASRHDKERKPMMLSIHPAVAPLIALVAGILILLMPRILNYVIALYLILVGLLGLFGGHLTA
jgi:Protein of unknown function (DUF3096)